MNVVNLIGNLGRENELHHSQGGTAYLRQSLAVRRNFKNEATGEYETDWVNITMFGKRAENFEKFTQKGSKVGITGRIQSGSYEKDGRTVYTTEIIVDQFHLIESRNQQNNDGYSSQNNYQGNSQGSYSNSGNQQKISQNDYNYNKDSKSLEGNMPFNASDGTPIDISEDDLPF